MAARLDGEERALRWWVEACALAVPESCARLEAAVAAAGGPPPALTSALEADCALAARLPGEVQAAARCELLGAIREQACRAGAACEDAGD